MSNALATDPDLNGIITLGPTGAAPTLAALRESTRPGEVSFATFDLTPEVAEAIGDGSILFAVDQQPYLQGYLPVVALVTYLETETIPGGGDVLKTGPGFVTRDNVARIVELSRRGLR